MKSNFGKIQTSILWSTGSEISVKLITPITNMILARILTPADFGILAVCNMLISFVDLITDAGFGKYLVQHDFETDEELDKFSSVAFWSNLTLSILLSVLIFVFRNSIASLMGNSNYSTVISVSCLQLIFTSMVSIQTGLMRRKFQYNLLFISRICVAVVPLLVTVPLAFYTRSYWALIIGNILGVLINSLVLSLCSSWHPILYYSFDKLKRMFSFSFWTLCEALAHWIIFWFDTFLVSRFFSDYYVGLYKNSANMIISLIGMVTASISPVLFSTLSRLNRSTDFYNVFLNVERLVSFVLFPMGIGLYFYRDFVTNILLGSQWEKAADIVGLWALMMVINVIIYSFPAEAFKSKGQPKILFFYQISYLLILVPLCIFSLKYGFWTFVNVRALSIFVQVLLCCIFIKIFLNWSVLSFFINLIPPFISSLVVLFLCIILRMIIPSNFYFNLASIFFICVVYLLVISIFFKKDILESWKSINKPNL